MAEPRTLIAIVPARASTRMAVFLDSAIVHQAEVPLTPSDASLPPAGQLAGRRAAVKEFLGKSRFDSKAAKAVACAGGMLRPVPPGVYRVSEAMQADLDASLERWGFDHPVNLGAAIAGELAREYGCPAFAVDPVSTDEMEDAARLTGVPDMRRHALGHALNVRAAARFACEKVRKKPEEARLVVAHLGDAVTVAAVRGGRIVDSTNSFLGTGPFGARRAGTLPAAELIALVSGGTIAPDALRDKLMGEAGLFAYTGSADGLAIANKVKFGDGGARLALEGLCVSVAKEIGALSTMLGGACDGVVLTGGLARIPHVVNWVQERVHAIAPVIAVPGDRELHGIAESLLRVLSGADSPRDYPPPSS